MADSCLMILCGLPGVGKSTFGLNMVKLLSNENKLKAIRKHPNFKENSEQDARFHTVYICFDDILPENLYAQSNFSSENRPDEEKEKTWKQYRSTIHDVVDHFMKAHSKALEISPSRSETSMQQEFIHVFSKIKEEHACICWQDAMKKGKCNCGARHIIIIDDNMFYSSMRYKYFQIARQNVSGFQEICLTCDMETLLKQNSERLCSVSEETIYNMSSIFEIPDPGKNKWESNLIKYDTVKDSCDEKIVEVLNLIFYCLDNPEQPFEDIDKSKKEIASQINATNVLYQVDQFLRKSISTEIQRLKDTSISKEALQRQSLLLNSKKKSFMSALKKSDQALKQLDFLLSNLHANKDEVKDLDTESMKLVCCKGSAVSSEHSIESCISHRHSLANANFYCSSLLTKCGFEEVMEKIFEKYEKDQEIESSFLWESGHRADDS